MLKLVGAALVVFGAAAVGFGHAAQVRRQLTQLGELGARLWDLRADMAYRLTPLPELLVQTGEGCKTPVGDFFTAFGTYLSGGVLMSVPAAARIALDQANGLVLPEGAKEAVLSLSLSLGTLDLDGQLKALDLARQRLEEELTVMKAGKRARCRSYQTIGVCAGLALAVILL